MKEPETAFHEMLWKKNFTVYPSLKAFDCIPHDLLIAKLTAYNFSDEVSSYIYSYLINRREFVRLSNSQLEIIILGVS